MKRFGEDFFQEKTKKIVIICLVVLVVFVSFYSFKSVHYAERLLPKTKVNNINVGGLTVDQANRKINAKLTEAPVAISLDNKLWKKIKRSELGWQKDHLEALMQIKQKQVPFAWGINNLLGSQHQLSSSYDQAYVDQLVENLGNEILQKNVTRTPTTNAKIEWVEGDFVIVPEKQGDTIDVEAAQRALIKNLENGKQTVNAEDYYAQPILTKDDSQLKKLKDQMNKLVKIEATYTINGKQVVIPAEELASWLTTNEKAEMQLDQEKVTAFVTNLNGEYNTKENPTAFTSTKRGEVSVPVGIYSWSINIPAEVEALSTQILKGKNFNRTPVVESEVPNVQTSIGNTYVEVDLQNQYMWYYKEGQLQFETDIVSGKPSTPTPPGVNYVTSKSTDQILRGLNDDGSKYASPVRYWMPIDKTGVGIHDSDWQYAYGGDLWLYRGSHGCINTPPAKMDELYPILEVGTPVIVF
ncbi:L,D-transpeptidase family protein [Candidatus Enterococcus murrayae]|uniref:L,D-transpeptidase/peptidoglycan binding protein n=1 Tax=Candidatus Enterococcus murrayae TaxID=2815321 RepID=A0ABS3HJR0_9ENTE|nr:L,D-transpeptidase family protein [Enterococcus sp. MJM16]MBO0453679.1 L,D-transpeptidase/peptidoglycan binding protein [Enterococcus sp. MJM16]